MLAWAIAVRVVEAVPVEVMDKMLPIGEVVSWALGLSFILAAISVRGLVAGPLLPFAAFVGWCFLPDHDLIGGLMREDGGTSYLIASVAAALLVASSPLMGWLGWSLLRGDGSPGDAHAW